MILYYAARRVQKERDGQKEANDQKSGKDREIPENR